MPAVTDSTLVDQTTLESFFQLKTGITNEIWQDVLIEGAILIGICAAVWFVTRFTAKVIMKSVSNKTKSEFDDYLLNYNFFKWVANIIPALIIEVQERSVFGEILNDHSLVYKLTDALIAVLVTRAVIAFINATRDFLSKKPSLRDKPMASYSQLAKIFIYFISGIIIFSILSEKSPIYFLSAMGAMTAVMLLIFKDTILGFVASIQLSANDMIRIGDWISMPKFGADGDVLEINLTTIKVINFDKTITTIPTYSFISDSFKNWRGMEESDGRRIKRAINIKIGSVKFCDDGLLERFSKVHLVSEYIDKKRKEIKEYNVDQQIDKSILANGRHLTNIGVFRVYLENYLRSNPYINTDMTSMVRQLHASENGLPIEIYAFSRDKDWGNYEIIVADLFDHIIATAPEFDLEIFQSPTGSDFSKALS
jgi:miniconductance mechanosensitive channel